MKILIDLELLKSLGISPDMYVFLYVEYNKFLYEEISLVNIESTIAHLQHQGFIKLTDEGIVLRQKALNLFITDIKEQQFMEFFNTYPMKVPNGKGGYRPLRPASVDTKLGKDIKRRYDKLIVSKETTHDELMSALEAYLANQRNAMQYFIGIEVFLNGEWAKWVGMNAEKENDGRGQSEDI
jgi:hypothetical protein